MKTFCRCLAVAVATLASCHSLSAQPPPKRDFPYRELEGTVEEFAFMRQWRSYYWRDDFTMQVRDAEGKLHRVISREPTPWNNLRLGTTYTGLAVDWTRQPRVQVIGVQAVDRIPAEFYQLQLDPQQTVTAFIVRVKPGKDDKYRDFYVNNWFHDWGPEADRKMLPHYATDDPNYTIFGFLGGVAAPFDAEGKKLLQKFEGDYGGIIYHGRVLKTTAEPGYEVHVLHLMGRHKKTASYDIFYGNPKEIPVLDGNAPPEAKKKK